MNDLEPDQEMRSLRARAPSCWLPLSLLAAFGMLVVCGLMLWDLRQDAWEKAEQTSQNLLHVIERDIARNIEIIDLSLQGVVDNLRAPGTMEVSPELRQLILFDRAATAKDIGVMLVIDEHGDSIIDAAAVPARKVNYADRGYFQAHQASPDVGLFISRPLVSRLTGQPMIALARRINKPDGSFAGVVMGTLKLSYFQRLFDRLGLGEEGAINLYLRDGTRLMRQPFVAADIGANIAGSVTFDRFTREGHGSFIETSVRDGVRRHYTFMQVGDYPLILNVALGVSEIEADWRVKATVIGSIVAALALLLVGLAFMFARELRRRTAAEQEARVANAELALLSMTDALTGLPNRRSFDDVLAREGRRAARTNKPLALLMLDADHFKGFNDRYGHQKGDEALRLIAHVLASHTLRPQDVACRIGGEEFAVVLPETDEAGAMVVANRIRFALEVEAMPHAANPHGVVTISCGVAAHAPASADGLPQLVAEADAALYAAKRAGRNNVSPGSARPAHALRLVAC